MKTSILLVGAVLFAMGATVAYAGPAVVDWTDLVGTWDSYAVGINDTGQVVANDYSGGFVVYNADKTSSFQSDANYYSQARAFNNGGSVVGAYGPPGTWLTDISSQAGRWNSSAPENLGVPPGTQHTDDSNPALRTEGDLYNWAAVGINNTGNVIGNSQVAADLGYGMGLPLRGFFMDSNGTWRSIDDPNGQVASNAYDLNNFGHVVAQDGSGGGFVWYGPGLTAALCSQSAGVMAAINDSDKVAGNTYDESWTLHAAVWDASNPANITSANLAEGGFLSSQAVDINNAGNIGGWVTNIFNGVNEWDECIYDEDWNCIETIHHADPYVEYVNSAAVWTERSGAYQLINLQDILEGLTGLDFYSSQVIGLNNNSDILVSAGRIDEYGQWNSYTYVMQDVVPEPISMVMLGGLGLGMAAARKLRGKRA